MATDSPYQMMPLSEEDKAEVRRWYDEGDRAKHDPESCVFCAELRRLEDGGD